MKKITESDFNRHIRTDLYRKGLSESERRKAKLAFLGDTDEGKITQRELEQRVKELRKNKSEYGFSDKKIDTIEETLKKRLH